MEQSAIRLDKARSFSETLTTVFDVLRQIARPLLRVLLINAGPYLALGALLVGLGFSNVIGSLRLLVTAPNQVASDTLASLIKDFTYWAIGIPVFTAATIVIFVVSQSYVITYQQLGRVPTDVEARDGRRGAWGTALRLVVFIYLGFVICVAVIASPLLISEYLLMITIPIGTVAWMLATVPLMIAFSVCRAEGLSVIPGIRYAWKLTEGHWWFCVGVFVMISIVQGLLGSVTNIIQYAGMVAVMASGLESAAASDVGTYLLAGTYGLNLFVSAFLGAMLHVSIVVTYYCLVERHEARALSHTIDQLGQP